MKKRICILALIIGTIACQKENIGSPSTRATTTSLETNVLTTLAPTSPTVSLTDLQNQTLVLEGTFVNGVHSTSGTVKVYEDKSKNRSLVFENFKTDAGPDLRIYMAEDKALSNFTQITDKVNTSGSYILPIPSNVDLKKQSTVIIWCRAFSVLFGSAALN